jgi:hypothetical protein
VSYRIGDRRFSKRLFSDIRCVVAPDNPQIDRTLLAETAKKAGIPLCND